MKSKEVIADGQISIFDMQFTEKPIKVTKTEEKVTENKVLITEKPILNTKEKIEKDSRPLELTVKQQEFLNKNRILENENLSRIIIHSKGSITVETKESDIFASHYITIEGKEELSYSNKSPVLPWEKIIYYNPELENSALTKIQTDKLQKLLCSQRENIKRVVRRKADENVIMEFEDHVLSITPIGWELPYISINHIECLEDEIYLIPNKEVKEEALEDVEKVVKVGDYVQASYGDELIEGEVFSEYNNGDTFNIIFSNGTKHTAIPRVAIKKILKSA